MSEEQRATTTTTTRSEPDTREPTPERQAARSSAYEANVAAGKPPYEGVQIGTLGELDWIFRQRNWSGANYLPDGKERADLRKAYFLYALLVGARLYEAALREADFTWADMRFASLDRADMSSARLAFTNLAGTYLIRVNLADSWLGDANLSVAHLMDAHLVRAEMDGSNLVGADLTNVDLTGSSLIGVRMDAISNPVSALVFSVTSFHGRGFFPGGLALDDPITVLAALEAAIGLFIEITFIATFTQRFFGGR